MLYSIFSQCNAMLRSMVADTVATDIRVARDTGKNNEQNSAQNSLQGEELARFTRAARDVDTIATDPQESSAQDANGSTSASGLSRDAAYTQGAQDMGQQSDRETYCNEVLADYRLVLESRAASLLGRREVLTGKAKFGIFGDGKEVAHVALAKAMAAGDFRAGYYRDQTIMLATGTLTLEQMFAQLYADTDLDHEPGSGGRQMVNHTSTRCLDAAGHWQDLRQIIHSSADASPLSCQMPRSIGLALASKLYRYNSALHEMHTFSNAGSEVVFATIGDASTSEGLFWEAVNAAGVLKLPLIVSVWDDGYGISVPKECQTTKCSISELMQGFAPTAELPGVTIKAVKGWDYPELCKTYSELVAMARRDHQPAVLHVTELTQPQGHSTSGSHERYKSEERLAWEREYDCNRKMRAWILETGLASEEQLLQIEREAEQRANDALRSAWGNYTAPLTQDVATAQDLFEALARESRYADSVTDVSKELSAAINPTRRDVMIAVKQCLRITRGENSDTRKTLRDWRDVYEEENFRRYSSHLHSESSESALAVEEVPAVYSGSSPMYNGNQIIQSCMDKLLERDSRVCIFGEDVGIGDVNHGLLGLQDKYGKLRVFDTGIREATIIGKAIGLAMRGLRPIAEIQYLDYLLFGLEPISDDLATLQYRTRGGQKAPVIIRTRGHRLEGIWHTGSPLGMIINAMRGIYVLVPRNMTQAAGFYNTMLASDEPALLIECLNGYGLKERLPDNIAEFRVPLGVPEVLSEGRDVTVVTYGACCRVAEQAGAQLMELGISVELIDVQSLLPFDVNNLILESIKKTNRVIFMDEDVPGGATAYMMQKVLEEQGGYYLLDSKPRTVTAAEHRSPYGSEGDYFSKPNAEDLTEVVYDMMNESDPSRFPAL